MDSRNQKTALAGLPLSKERKRGRPAMPRSGTIFAAMRARAAAPFGADGRFGSGVTRWLWPRAAWRDAAGGSVGSSACRIGPSPRRSARCERTGSIFLIRCGAYLARGLVRFYMSKRSDTTRGGFQCCRARAHFLRGFVALRCSYNTGLPRGAEPNCAAVGIFRAVARSAHFFSGHGSSGSR